MLDAIKGYVELATGLTEVTVKRAQEAAQSLVNQGMSMLSTDAVPDVPGKDQAVDAAKTAANSVQELADELLETSKQNRDLLTGLIRTEVDRSAGRMGFVREAELAAVRRHIARLENQIADMRMTVAPNTQAPASAAFDSSAVAAAEAKVEAHVADGSVDDSKVEDVVAATSDLADAVATHVDDAASAVIEAVSSAVDQTENVVTDAASTVLADVHDVVGEATPAKRKIPYVKPGTEIIEESS
jgi:polyhydroxyalkanoate synthesis regulator phasin